MKIFFSGSNDVNKEIKKFYLDVIKLVQDFGNEIEHNLIINFSEKTHKTDIVFQDIYEKVLKQIDKSEVFLVDISYPSGGVGYQVYHAIYQRKPIIIFYKESKQTNPSVIMRGINLKNVILIKYTTINDLKEKLSVALNKASKMIKVRFNLVMSNEYFSFIENQSQKLKMSKTSFILNLIKEKKEKDQY